MIEAAWLLVKGFVGKIPAGVWKALGAVAVGLAFLWVAYSSGADDAKDKAAVKEAVALKEQAEAHAKKVEELALTISTANANIGKTEVRVIRESADARREIEAVPGAQRTIDPEAWRIARAAMGRIRGDGLHDGASDSDDPPIGGIVARPVG